LRLTPSTALMGLLAFAPLALAAEWLHWGPVLVFSFAALAIVPLAGLMGESTERLAAKLGAGIGGLLNATFGNAAELIIALVALQHGLHDVVKASLTGSIIGNSLLVLGLAILLGGLGRERQTFDRSAAGVGGTLLALSAIGFVVPTLFHVVLHATPQTPSLERAKALEQGLSLPISLVLLVAYLLSLLFALRTHRHLYAGAPVEAQHAAPGGTGRNLLVLLLATAAIAWMSELLVGAVEGASHALGLTPVFVGVIVVAVVGNAAEHSTAVMMALRNQMDLAINIAVGSSTQIALLLAPLLVIASRFIGPSPMDMHFTVFEVVAVGLAVAVVNLVALDGESNWLEGALLLAVYLILGIAFFFLP
jgi:Ca2+:H+ antiporter